MNDSSNSFRRRKFMQGFCIAAGGLAIGPIFGCSHVIVAGSKLINGDPKQEAEFTTLTHEDLSKGLRTVLVVCSSPEAVEDDVSTLRLDLIDGVARRMKLNGVRVINPDQVADWIDEHDGVVSDLQSLATDFETDYIAWIDVQAFSLHEPNSQRLLRGRTSGFIHVYKVEERDSRPMALKVYSREFSMTYPQHQPISEQGRGLDVFQKDYVKQLCDFLSERFYNHRPGNRF